jgi:vesicle transport through interaction with t-SNAREs protein 1
MSIFDAYNQEFTSLSQDISKNISEYRTYSDGEKALSIGRHVEALFVQATDLIKQMELEVRSNDAATRKVLGEKLNTYKKSLASMKSDYESARNDAQKSSLIGNKSLEQRQRLLDTNSK